MSIALTGPEPFHTNPSEALPAGTARLSLKGTFSMAGPLVLSADNHYVWTEGLIRIDPRTNQAVNLAKGTEADFVEPAAGSIWASDFNNDVVRRYNGAGTLLATIPIPDGPEGLAATPGAIWVASHHGGTLDRIDTTTNTVTNRVQVTTPGSSGAQNVTSALGSVWTGTSNTLSVVRVNPQTRRKTLTIPLVNAQGDPCGGIAITPKAGWAPSCLDGPQLVEFDPRTGSVLRSQNIGGKVYGMAADGDTVWFVAGGDPDPSYDFNVVGVLVQLDAQWHVLHKYTLGPSFTSGGIIKAFGSIWISSSAGPEVLRIPLPAR